jgi:spore coat polysaccharide biosynthesis protein SpsF
VKIVAIVQARMGSTRLPGKVMRDLCGMPVLAHVIRALEAVPRIDEIVVATTTHAKDDVVAQCAANHGATVFRGSEDDVLDRYFQAAREAGADIVLRITADCPFLDAELIDVMIGRSLEAFGNVDYLSNSLERTFPRGFDADVIKFSALERAWREARSAGEREHVTPYIIRHPEIFRLVGHTRPRDASEYRLTLDTEDDWLLIDAVCKALQCGKRRPSGEELIAFLEARPDIAALNAHVEQKKVGQ